MPNLADLLTRSAAARPDRVAVKLDERELTYADARRRHRPRRRPAARQGRRSPATASASCCPTSRTSRSATTARCAPARRSCR